MNKTNDSIPHVWGEKRPVIGVLYQFPETIEAASLRILSTTNLEKSNNPHVEEGTKRSFKTARLFQFNEEYQKCFFVGHKIPQNGAKKSNQKYVFGLSLPPVQK